MTSIYDGSSTSSRLTGLMWLSAWQECPQAEITGIAVEYGRQPLEQVFGALRAEQGLENHPETPAATRDAVKRQIRDALYTDTPEWKRAIVEQALAAGRQALAGLAARPRSA